MSPRLNSLASTWLPLLFLLLVFLSLRLPGLGRFATIDEVHWYRVAIMFRQKLIQGEWQDTVLSAHPGITTLWAGTLGTQWRYPEIREFADAEYTDFHLRHHLWQSAVNPNEIIAAGRTFIVLFNAAAFALLWPPLRRLLGQTGAFLSMGLLALDPFLIAHQRLLHQDGLMASFGLLCLVAFAAYQDSRKSGYLFLSAAAAGLAWLTKSPMLLLAPMLGLAALLADRPRSLASLWASLRPLLLWGLAALATFSLLWPAMLANPLAAIQGVLSYALGSAQGEFSGQIFFNGQVYPDGKLGAASWLFYPLSILWRATPITLLGLGMAALALFSRQPRPAAANKLFATLALFGLGFLLLMTLADKKFDRYILPAYITLLPLAAWGLTQLLAAIGRLWAGRPAQFARTALLAAFLLAQLGSSLPTAPVFLDYYNPLLGGHAAAPRVMMLGWGEGLEQAAQYIRAETRGQAAPRVAAWYSNLFMLFYGGDVVDIPLAAQATPAQLDELLSMDYLVIYVHQWQRQMPQNLLDALSGRQPVHTVYIGGQPYAQVYRLSE